MWLKGGGSGKITGVHPKYPETEKLNGDRNLFVTSTKDYIAKTKGTRTFPWRAFVIAGNDGQLVESDLVFKLAAPNRITDTKWIKPGQVAWDWWNANNIYGVDFRAGINNDTYKYYIDFASKNGIEYIILDEGWYKTGTMFLSRFLRSMFLNSANMLKAKMWELFCGWSGRLSGTRLMRQSHFMKNGE